MHLFTASKQTVDAFLLNLGNVWIQKIPQLRRVFRVVTLGLEPRIL